MELRIFNVGHGFCALLIADNGNVILFDSGYSDETGFRPSHYLPFTGCTAIERFVVTNLDDDHVADLPNLRRTLPIQILHRNNSISPEKLRALKLQAGPLSPGLQALLEMMQSYTSSVTNPPLFPNVEFVTFQNNYPIFTDTNNLSLVSFIHYDRMGIILPGDLERAGWQMLLQNSAFVAHVRQVNIFVASHHGRESGYLQEVFDYCAPDIVVISDVAKRHDSQENEYARHARGVPWNQGSATRYVLTTRRDGNISISKRIGAGYYINTGWTL